MTRHLTKSRFASGLQCHKLLWWKGHEPDASELLPDPAAQLIMDEGIRVGEVARALFPGGVLIDLPHDQVQARVDAGKVSPVEATRASIEVAQARVRRARAIRELEVARVRLVATWGSTASR